MFKTDYHVHVDWNPEKDLVEKMEEYAREATNGALQPLVLSSIIGVGSFPDMGNGIPLPM